MEESEQAIIDWVNTFGLSRSCVQISELFDGTIIEEILFEIDPVFFEKDVCIKEAGDNWALVAGNLRKIVRALDDYYTTVLQKEISMASLDVNKIAKEGDKEMMMQLMMFVVGVAVMCENKAVFIRNIFLLDQASQVVLKELVEQVMGMAGEIGGDNEGDGTENDIDGGDRDREGDRDSVGTGINNHDKNNNDDHSSSAPNTPGFTASGDSLSLKMAEEDAARSKEMLTHVLEERDRLLSEVKSLKESEKSIRKEVRELREQLTHVKEEAAATENSERGKAAKAEQHATKLQAEFDETRHDLDMRNREIDEVKAELKTLKGKLDASLELQAKLEMETRQQADELDVARDLDLKLLKAEQTIEKYQQRLEEMVALKKQNQELNELMDTYLDQIHDLESTAKGISTLNKLVEQYKNRAVELERENFEAISAAQLKESEVKRLEEELAQAKEATQFAEFEVANVKKQMQREIDELTVQHAMPPEDTTGGEGEEQEEEGAGSSAFELETVPSLKAKVKKLERQIRTLTTAGASSSSTAAGTGSGAGSEGLGAEGAGSVESAGEQIRVLQQELVDVRSMKREREEALMGAQKQLNEAQYELGKARKQVEEAKLQAQAQGQQEKAQELKDSVQQLKDTTQKLAEKANTVRMLEDRLKEKESTINKLQQDRSKLENYAKRSLSAFKDKYMAVLQAVKDEKTELQNKVKLQAEKYFSHQETWRREERLIASALFEIGVRMMDKKTQQQMQESAEHPSTYMAVSREALQQLLAEPMLSSASAQHGTAAGHLHQQSV